MKITLRTLDPYHRGGVGGGQETLGPIPSGGGGGTEKPWDPQPYIYIYIYIYIHGHAYLVPLLFIYIGTKSTEKI